MRYRTPVILLSDTLPGLLLGAVADPDRGRSAARSIPRSPARRATARRSCPTAATSGWPARGRSPARRASSTASAAWRRPTAPATSPTTAANHARMTELRAAKVAGIAREVPTLQVDADPGAELLVLGWGSSEGAIRAGVRRARGGPAKVASAQLRHLNPLPGQHRRGAALVRPGAGARDEHRPAGPGAAGAGSSSTSSR